MDENHYVTVEEYQRLLAMAQQKKDGWFSRVVGIALWIFNGCAGVILIWLFVPMLFGTPAALPPPPANAQGTPYPTAPAQRQPPGGGETSHIYSGGPLPSCDAVTDTRTACEPPAEQAPAAQQAEPTPAVLTLAPAAVECYKGSFYTCEELAEMGDEGATEAVKETDAFVDVQTLPTPEPAFVEYATNACQAAAVKSPLCP